MSLFVNRLWHLNLLGSLILLFSLGNPAHADHLSPTVKRVRLGFGADHAKLEADQSVPTEQFKKKYLYDDQGKISLKKLDEFLQRLQAEQARVYDDVRETQLIEKVEIQIASPAKAIQKFNNLGSKAEKLLSLYPVYLIPTIQTLRNLVAENRNPQSWPGYIDDFVRAYHLFYYPNAGHSEWTQNTDIPRFVKRMIIPYKFKKNDAKDEAINLIVEEDNLKMVRECLPMVKAGDYMSRGQIKLLKQCGFDLSLLDPGVSGFWEKRSNDEKAEFRENRPDIFPSETDEVRFRDVKTTGMNSPKLNVDAMVNGKLRRYKLKWGVETHIQNALSLFAYHLGFNQDTLQYRPRLKIYLGKRTLTEFYSIVMTRYPTGDILGNIIEHGGTLGNEWVVLRDCMLAARPDEEIRVSAFDPTAMDFNFRREFNGRILYHSFFNLIDGKNANFRMLLAPPTPEKALIEPRPRIKLRFHDTGFALGAGLSLRRPDQPLWVQWEYLPNEFQESGMVTTNKDKSEVAVHWDDFYYQQNVYKNTTYSDLKWMARKLISVSPAEILWCLRTSGMPEEVAKVYQYKLIKRQEEIRNVFNLGAAPADWKPEIENLPTYTSTPDAPGEQPAVEKGKVVKFHFKGKTVTLPNRTDLVYFITTQIAGIIGKIPAQTSFAQRDSNHQNFDPNQYSNMTIGGMVGLDTNIGASLDPQLKKNSTIDLDIQQGVKVSIARVVLYNSLPIHSEDDHKARAYLVKDYLTVQIAADASLFKQLLGFFPLQISASLKFFEFHFEYNHYAESFWGGYTTSLVPFFKMLVNPIGVATEDLGRMEMLLTSYSVGIEGAVGATVFEYAPVFRNGVSASAGAVSLHKQAYFRDPWGRLHSFEEETEKKYAGVDVALVRLSIPFINDMAFIGYRNTVMKFHTRQRDVLATTDGEASTLDSPILDKDGRYKDALKRLKLDDPTLPKGLNLYFGLEAEGKIKDRSSSLLYAFNKSKKSIGVKTTINLQDGREKVLSRFSSVRDSSTGVQNSIPHLMQSDLMVKGGNRIFIRTELNEKSTGDMTVILRIVNFIRSSNRSGLLSFIDDLNRMFSKTKDEPFYRNFELPSEEEVNDYRRLYGMTRIYASGKELLDRVEKMDSREFELKARAFFEKGKQEESHQARADLNWFAGKSHDIAVGHLTRQLVGRFEALKKKASEPIHDYKAMMPLIDEFLYDQKIHRWGLSLLQDLMGDENLFVMGEVSGVFPAFSTAMDFQWRQRRRFAGKHWGALDQVPALQYHLRFDNVLPLNPFGNDIPSNILFGDHPSGDPAEMAVQWQ
jgi:hypothetical protein